jgi:hypothetical protein
MQFQLILAGLAAFAAAAPMEPASDDKSMKGYTPYTSYGSAYYETYTPYSASVEEEGAKVSSLHYIPDPSSYHPRPLQYRDRH